MIRNIYGHKKNLDMLMQRIKAGKLAHAYVFDGTEGIGKLDFAKHIAMELICGKDEAKRKFFEAGSHGDFLFIEAQDDKIKVEDIGEVFTFLSTQPLISKHKVVLIDGAEKLNAIAQNKLLKIIEEPPSYALFILISTRYDLLLDTLKSRLIRLSFNPLSKEEIKQYCDMENIEFSEDAAQVSGGSIKKYLSLIEGTISSSSSLARDLAAALEKANTFLIQESMTKICEEKAELLAILNELESIYRGNVQALAAISETRYRYYRNAQQDLLISYMVSNLEAAASNH